MAVCVGRLWDQGKNAACIVKAAEMLPDMEFVLIGPTTGPDGNYLQVTPPPNVSFPGKLPPSKVRKILSNAAIYVGPSLYEPFGLSPLEAATASCALVMSDIPSFREIWEDAALYFPPDKPETLAERLQFLADKPDQVCRHATMARFRAFTFYTAERMAEQYYELYKTLMTPSSRPDPLPDQIPHAC
jgi:glycosyltransferase involved in cell wall biosynthesis